MLMQQDSAINWAWQLGNLWLSFWTDALRANIGNITHTRFNIWIIDKAYALI